MWGYGSFQIKPNKFKSKNVVLSQKLLVYAFSPLTYKDGTCTRILKDSPVTWLNGSYVTDQRSTTGGSVSIFKCRFPHHTTINCPKFLPHWTWKFCIRSPLQIKSIKKTPQKLQCPNVSYLQRDKIWWVYAAKQGIALSMPHIQDARLQWNTANLLWAKTQEFCCCRPLCSFENALSTLALSITKKIKLLLSLKAEHWFKSF